MLYMSLNPFEEKVIEAMKALGATSEDKIKDADQIAKAAKLPKGRVAATLVSLVQKGYVKKITRHKRAGYYLLK